VGGTEKPGENGRGGNGKFQETNTELAAAETTDRCGRRSHNRPSDAIATLISQ